MSVFGGQRPHRHKRRPKLAEFESDCPECSMSIAIGDEITQNDDGLWVHERCG